MRRTISTGLKAMRLAALIAIPALAMPALGQPGIESMLERQLYCEEHTLECANDAMLLEFRRRFLSGARIHLGAEQRLPNGVAWRLFTDASTGGSLPRITWMPNRQALIKANWLFDAIQGSHLQYTGSQMLQSDVALTYATAGYVGYTEIFSFKDRWNVLDALVIGRLIDLRAGKIFSAESCSMKSDGASSGYGWFRFGDLLEVCDSETSDRFHTLWDSNMTVAARKAEDAGDVQALACLQAMEDRPYPKAEVALALTPTGLAAYNTSYFPDRLMHCVLVKNAINPTIIPYRELEWLMKPGLLKDELLAIAK